MPKEQREISIDEAVGELLYLNDCVIIPQFGGFVKNYKSAGFDYVQGKITPPASSLNFNENLIVDDGLLLDYYKKQNGISLEKAKETLQRFTQESKISLANKEVVTFPKIGRLLKDYENKIKFISENNNFNTDSYGLPDINYYPIMREMPRNEKKTTAVPPPVEAKGKTKSSPRRSQQIAKIAIPLFLLLILFTAYQYFFGNKNTESVAEDIVVVPSEKVDVDKLNKKPGETEGIDYNPTDKPRDKKPTDSDDMPPVLDGETDGRVEEPGSTEPTDSASKDKPKEDTQTAKPPVATGDEFEVIFVGVFSKRKGVDIRISMIEDNGWIPFTEKTKKGYTKVGLRVPDGEKGASLLAEVKRKIDKDAFVSKRR